MNCPYCLAPLPDDALYCDSCGKTLVEETAPVPISEADAGEWTLDQTAPVPEAESQAPVVLESEPVPEVQSDESEAAETAPIPEVQSEEQVQTEPTTVPDMENEQQVIEEAETALETQSERPLAVEPKPVPVTKTDAPVVPVPMPMHTEDIHLPEKQEPNTVPLAYAGFFRRLLAFIMDSIVLSGLAWIISLIFPESVTFKFGWIAFITGWLYYSLMETTKPQATLGKLALGIRVTDLDGERIGFLRATARHLSKFLSVIILLIGFLMAGWTEKKQALHDMIAGTLVVKR